MRNRHTLYIPQPCQENWQEMKYTKNGKFCQNCLHSVIDITNLSDNEVIKLIENTQDSLCFRSKKYQLNRELIESNYEKRSFYKIIAGFFLLLFTSLSYSQKRSTKTQHSQNQAENKKSIKSKEVSKSYSIEGVVKDSISGYNIGYATVYIENTNYGTKTDSNGRFKITILDSFYHNTSKLSLLCRYPGYLKKKIALQKEKSKNIEILLAENLDSVIMGKVISTKKDNPK